MPTTLATPIVGPTVTNVAVVAFETRWTAGVLSCVDFACPYPSTHDSLAALSPLWIECGFGLPVGARQDPGDTGSSPFVDLLLAALAAINPAIAGAVS